MNKTLSIALKSLALIFVIHFLIIHFEKKSNFFDFLKPSTKVNIEKYQNKINELEIKISNLKSQFADNDDIVKPIIVNEPIKNSVSSCNKVLKHDTHTTIEIPKQKDELNLENIQNDLENYLDNQEFNDKSSIDEMYQKSDFQNEKTDFSNQYDLEKYEQKTSNSKEESNKMNYEEWVYNNENKMNGVELFDGIFAYDDMLTNYQTL